MGDRFPSGITDRLQRNPQYVSVEPFHLFRYLDEQSFHYNNRLPMKDGDRFGFLVRKIVGKRLTYKQLTGKEHERHPAFLIKPGVERQGRGK
jgi:hypothetical protein